MPALSLLVFNLHNKKIGFRCKPVHGLNLLTQLISHICVPNKSVAPHLPFDEDSCSLFPVWFYNFRSLHSSTEYHLAVYLIFAVDRHFPTTPRSYSHRWRKWRTTHHRYVFKIHILILETLTRFGMQINVLFRTGRDCWGLSPSRSS